jgi:hypothetical protein
MSQRAVKVPAIDTKSGFSMTPFLRISALLLALCAAQQASALAIGGAEMRASRALSCVLAEDALGYLEEDQFNQRFDAVVEGFSDGAVDIIYAKALGYIDGLLFGVPSQDQTEALRRLQDLSNSQACSSAVKLGVSL